MPALMSAGLPPCVAGCAAARGWHGYDKQPPAAPQGDEPGGFQQPFVRKNSSADRPNQRSPIFSSCYTPLFWFPAWHLAFAEFFFSRWAARTSSRPVVLARTVPTTKSIRAACLRCGNGTRSLPCKCAHLTATAQPPTCSVVPLWNLQSNLKLIDRNIMLVRCCHPAC